jgi:hypothetical protein
VGAKLQQLLSFFFCRGNGKQREREKIKRGARSKGGEEKPKKEKGRLRKKERKKVAQKKMREKRGEKKVNPFKM